MKRAALLAFAIALPAFADIPPQETWDCRSKQAGATCKTPDGKDGTCVQMEFKRPPFKGGGSYTALGCRETATAPAPKKAALPWLGVGIAFLALAGAARFSRRPSAGAA